MQMIDTLATEELQSRLSALATINRMTHQLLRTGYSFSRDELDDLDEMVSLCSRVCASTALNP